MAIRDILQSLEENDSAALDATGDENMLAAAEIEVDNMFQYDRPTVSANIDRG